MPRTRLTIQTLARVAMLLVAFCAGCASTSSLDKPRDESFSAAAGWERSSKEPSTSLPWGTSSRARDIERDLGVR